MEIKDIELFASAVVSSSSNELTVEEKLELFLKSKIIATEHNKKQPVPKAKAKTFKGGI